MKRARHETRSPGAACDTTSARARPANPLATLRGLLGRAGNAAMGRVFASTDRTPVPDGVRASVELSLGTSLEGARIVTGAEGDAVTRATEAEAATVGDAIFISRDAPPLSSPAGERLLSHELVHVAQQREATSVDAERVSEAGESQEAEADKGATAARLGTAAPLASAAATAGVQRQPKVDTRKQMIQSYFERLQKTQGATGIPVTASVRNVVTRMFAKDRLALPFALENLEKASTLSGKPADLAAAIARALTEQIETGDLAFLESLPGDGEAKGRAGRIGDLVEKSTPFKTPESQQAEWKFNFETSQLRKGQGGIDPLSVDVLQMGRILKGLRGAWKGAPPKSAQTPAPREVPALDKALDAIATDALIPAIERGKPGAGEYADAQEVARGLARSLDIAHQQHASSVDVRLGANYDKVKDPAAILAEVQRIIGVVKGVLPHHAPGIAVQVFFGDRLVRTFTLVRSE